MKKLLKDSALQNGGGKGANWCNNVETLKALGLNTRTLHSNIKSKFPHKNTVFFFFRNMYSVKN